MHHFLHVMRWVFEISGIVIAGLILLAGLIATVRAIVGIKTPLWNSSDVSAAEARASSEGWPHRVLVVLDIFLNVIVLFGKQDQTMSTHAWLASLEDKTWGKWMTTWLSWFQPNHGPLAASGDLARASAQVTQLSKSLGV